MKNYKSEKQILRIIKYTHPLLILLIGIIITIFAYLEYTSILKKEKAELKQQYIKENKALIKEQVTKAHEFILLKQKRADSKLRTTLKRQANNAHLIATTIYNQNKETKSKDEISQMIKDALKDIRFNNGRGYYVVYDKAKQKNNPNRQYPLKDMLNLVNKKDGVFYTFYWYKSKYDKKKYKRLGYARNFKPYDWIIGTGEFIDDHTQELKQEIINEFKKVKFGLNQNSYFCIFDYSGEVLVHFKEELIGENFLLTNKSPMKKQNINQIINQAKEGEGYISYLQGEKPNNGLPVEKTSYVQGMKGWNWAIETGFYDDDINAMILDEQKELDGQFKQYIQSILMISLFITFLFLVTSIYISRRLERNFSEYKKEIDNHVEEYKKQHDILSQQTKMAAMGEMIGNIAHQWRQPLSVIATSATGMSLEKELGTLDNKKLESGLEGINQAAQHLSTTIDAFRNFFKQDKEINRVNLSDSLEKTLNLISAQFTSHEIELIQNIDEVKVSTIENELIQVLLNILNNARDILILQEYKRIIMIDIHIEGEFAVITIKDNAGGIPEEIIERVFEPYFTTKHQAQGTGIGLYMSQEIITKHLHGHINVENREFMFESKRYRGAEFKILLPMEAPQNFKK